MDSKYIIPLANGTTRKGLESLPNEAITKEMFEPLSEINANSEDYDGTHFKI